MKKFITVFVLISSFLFSFSHTLLFAAAGKAPTKQDGTIDASAPASAWGGLGGFFGFVAVRAFQTKPVAPPKNVIIFEDTNGLIDVQYADPFKRLAAFQLTKAPSNGNVSTSSLPGGVRFSYTPRTNFNGVDSFEYKIALAGGLESDPASVTITVQSVNDDPPTLVNLVFDYNASGPALQPTSGTTGTVISKTFSLPAVDADGENLIYSSAVQGLNSCITAASINPTTKVLTIAASTECENRMYTLTYSVSDGAGRASRSGQINVEMRNFTSSDGGGDQDSVIPASLRTHHDTIPNFSHPDNSQGRDIVKSVRSGDWLSPDTWEHRHVPTSEDIAVVHHHVILNGAADVHAVGIYPGGHLDFARDRDTELKTVQLQVFEHGHLEVGPIPSSRKAQIIIKDELIDTVIDPHQWGNGLVSIDGKVTIRGAEISKTFVRLTADAIKGTKSLLLAEPVNGWKAGDKVVIPDTRQLTDAERTGMDGPYVSQTEVLEIESVNGLTLKLRNALQYDHKGEAVMMRGTKIMDFLPHVALLTRNVAIHSEALSSASDRYCAPEEFGSVDCKTRGHVLLTSRSEVDVRYAQFQDLGRTVNKKLNNTLAPLSADNTNPPNHIGRYAFHMHHVMGPDLDNGGTQITVDGKSYQFVIMGNTSYGSRKWGMTIHGTHYGLVKDNVIVNAEGAGMMFEEGSETENLIDHNFVIGVTGTGRGDERSTDRDFGIEGSAFWFRGPNNRIVNNVTADSKFGYSYWHEGVGTVNIPTGPGKDVHTAAGAVPTNGNTIPVLEFDNNEAYGLGKGIMLWWLGSTHNGGLITSDSVLKNYRAWHVGTGIYGYPSSRVILDSPVMQNEQSKLKSDNGGSTGVTFGDYFTKRFQVKNPNIQGFNMGIEMAFYPDSENASGKDAGLMTVENGYLRNFYNIVIKNPGAPGACPGCFMSEKTAKITNVKMDRITWAELGIANSAGKKQPKNIFMNYNLQSNAVQLVKKDMALVYDYNGVPGDNFRVFYDEQRPDFIVPQSVRQPNTSVRLWASPVEGKTNAQNWEDYGIAIAGAVLPADVESRPDEITGKIRKIFPSTDLDQPIINSPVTETRTGSGMGLLITTSPVSVTNIGSTQATINWTTDEPVKTKVVYGISVTPPSNYDVEKIMDVYANWTPWSSALGKNHSITLTGLQPGTQYDFKALSLDAAGNLTVAKFEVRTADGNKSVLEEGSFKTAG